MLVGVPEHDPLRCLRCSAIAIGVWSILFCLVQLGLLGWQVQVVKQWQWYWENRELPATGAIDQYQARFPGLYQIYTETPERRRVNAMFAIVLICLGLTILHLPTSAAMLYGCTKRLPNWILPWFFTSVPLVFLCTAYSILWWSGDIFNEQLTFSIAEFTMSLAVNGVCIAIVFLYYLRLRGKLTSERPNGQLRWSEQRNIGPPPVIPVGQMPKGGISSADEKRRRQGLEKLPPWVESYPEKPNQAIERKLRRKERREREMGARLDREKEKKTRGKRTRAGGERQNITALDRLTAGQAPAALGTAMAMQRHGNC